MIKFPNPHGVLCIGGDLSENMLLSAYSQGIFPWFSKEDPIIWWSPNPRCVLYPQKLKVSKSLDQIIRKKVFEVRFDTCFHEVINQCAKVKREGQYDTWIVPSMIEAYTALHQRGFAHSVEVFKDSILVGGLYGVSLGKFFFGESMFHTVSNASKIALYSLVQHVQQWDFKLIDCQTTTEHLISMGAEEIPRKQFLQLLKGTQPSVGYFGKWNYITQ